MNNKIIFENVQDIQIATRRDVEGQITHQADLMLKQIFDRVFQTLDTQQRPTDFATYKK